MSSEVKRYDAVHLRYEDSNIRVELPFDTYGCMDADKVKEALASTGVPYK